MYFELLQLRLIAHVQERVLRGEMTERGLARSTGISQPHLHNMLKGARVLSPRMADLLLRHLHITLIDLLHAEEMAGCEAASGASPAYPGEPAALAFQERTAYSEWTATHPGRPRGAIRDCRRID